MDQEQKIKSYFFRKALIILLSLIIMLNGLGLIVAGKKVGKKSWVTAGIAYIVVEWVCAITGVGIILASILYFVSVIHTALICSEYGRLLNLQYNNISSNRFNETKTVYSTQPAMQSVGLHKEEIKAAPDPSIKIDRLPLNIGMAEINGKTKDSLKIKVQTENGKIYEFNTIGNVVESFGINGKTYNYGG